MRDQIKLNKKTLKWWRAKSWASDWLDSLPSLAYQSLSNVCDAWKKSLIFYLSSWKQKCCNWRDAGQLLWLSVKDVSDQTELNVDVVPRGSAGILPAGRTAETRSDGCASYSGCCCPSTGGRSAGSPSCVQVHCGSAPGSPCRWFPAGGEGRRYCLHMKKKKLSEKCDFFLLRGVNGQSVCASVYFTTRNRGMFISYTVLIKSSDHTQTQMTVSEPNRLQDSWRPLKIWFNCFETQLFSVRCNYR